MAMSGGNSGGGPMADINVTPLVDVMLVLLIIFMVTTPLMNHKTQVELPRADLAKDKKEQPGPGPSPITISMTEKGDLFFNDQPVTRDKLESELSVAAQRTPQPKLNLRADRTTKLQLVDEITRLAQAQGMLDIGYVAIAEKN